MSNIYLYRKTNIDFKRYPNPYMVNLESAISENFKIVNKQDNNKGVLDLLKYFFKTDLFYFNWIETLPERRFGIFQVIIFYFFLTAAKLSNKRILWTLHNKHSHKKGKNWLSNIMYRILIRYSNIILTHSEEGIKFLKTKNPKFVYKAKYIIHPSDKPFSVRRQPECKFDILIWGAIEPYKGILEFLKFVSNCEEMKPCKILIVGKCFDQKYHQLINKNLSENIIYKNHLFTVQEIAEFSSQSKYILFTYKAQSVLSSGALIDSIRMQATIIGPNEGAFKDLGRKGFVLNYKNYCDIPKLMEIEKHDLTPEHFSNFCKDNSWDSFAEKLKQIIEDIN